MFYLYAIVYFISSQKVIKSYNEEENSLYQFIYCFNNKSSKNDFWSS